MAVKPLTKAEARAALKSLQTSSTEAAQLSSQQRYANMRLGRAGMPEAEHNDGDAGDGARRKLPIRYD